jgi:uncharacterized membrane protein (Fun14 family)
MSGTFSAGIPSIVILAIPFIIGLVIGLIIKKAIKIGIIVLVIALVASYLGFISLGNLAQGAKNLVTNYGPVALSYVALFFGIIPLSIGLVIGVIIGFIFL